MASAGAEESTASTDSARAAACSAKPPVEVKQSSTRPRACRAAATIIFALVEIHAGLLAVQQIGFELQAVHLDGHSLRNFARQHRRFPAAGLPACERWRHCGQEFRPGASSSVRQSRIDIARAIHSLVRVCITR